MPNTFCKIPVVLSGYLSEYFPENQLHKTPIAQKPVFIETKAFVPEKMQKKAFKAGDL